MTHTGDTPLATFGNVQVSRFETATGPRLRLRRTTGVHMEAFLDPLELEGLTRVRYKPIALLPAGPSDQEERRTRKTTDPLQPLQNEFAMVGVAVARTDGEPGL